MQTEHCSLPRLSSMHVLIGLSLARQTISKPFSFLLLMSSLFLFWRNQVQVRVAVAVVVVVAGGNNSVWWHRVLHCRPHIRTVAVVAAVWYR